MRMVIIIILFAASGAHAQGVHRCVDLGGKVTFTQTGCGTALQPEHVYDATNSPPSGGKDVIPLATPDRFSGAPSDQRQKRPRVVVVGEKVDPCAKHVGGSPVGGHATGSIKSMYGRPDRVRTYNSRESWTWYETSRKPYRSVDFDENGCATSLYESETGRKR